MSLSFPATLGLSFCFALGFKGARGMESVVLSGWLIPLPFPASAGSHKLPVLKTYSPLKQNHVERVLCTLLSPGSPMDRCGSVGAQLEVHGAAGQDGSCHGPRSELLSRGAQHPRVTPPALLYNVTPPRVSRKGKSELAGPDIVTKHSMFL